MKIKDFIDYEQPTDYIVESDRYSDEYRTPVLTAGQSFILGYTNEKEGIYNKCPCIIFDDFTTSVHYVDFPFKVKSSAMKILTSKHNANIKYCYYLLLSLSKMPPNHKRQWISTTSEKKHFLPSIDNQVSIVKQLDLVSDIISHYTMQINHLDNLIKARFVELFGDPVTNPYSLPTVTLGELSELITKGASPSWQGFSYTDDNTQTLFITSENVREGYIDLLFPKYIEDGFNDKQKRSIIHKGDFLINIVGASIGRAAQFNLDCKANMNQAAALVRVNDKRIRDKYLLIYLNSERAQRMYDSMKSDTGRANLSLQDISDLSILLPPIERQIEFETFCKQVDKSKYDAMYVDINVLEYRCE